MVSDSAVCVENLSKSYLVGHARASHPLSFRDAVSHTFTSAVRKTFDVMRGRQLVQGDEVEEFWALKDVSFDVRPGEVLGIVGRNGAGKSTLLKILSRITEPTRGRVSLAGRVASLLEVGTGFHPELSGRENIFLNGAVLGMSREEMRRKLPDIVEFAGVERFIDTPVKRYSSGMYVRLAFSVAAHLEPDILIVDEVMAVGDREFQERCLGRMEAASSAEGRTVLFVSHNAAALTKLCPRSIRLENGSLVDDGPTADVLARYHRSARQRPSPSRSRRDTHGATILDVVVSAAGDRPEPPRCDRPVYVTIRYELTASIRDLRLSVGVTDPLGAVIFSSNPVDVELQLPAECGIYTATLTIPAELLLPRMYGLTVSLWSSALGALDAVEHTMHPQWAVTFATRHYQKQGALAIRCDWTLERADSKAPIRC